MCDIEKGFEYRIKHLEMIQDIISRMASNSFALKGWAVTLVAGVLALNGKAANKIYAFVLYIPIFMFWGLDAYYLLQERLFRNLYDNVRLLPENMKTDFSMKIMTNNSKGSNCQFCRCLFSKTELVFYLPLAVVSTLIIHIDH